MKEAESQLIQIGDDVTAEFQKALATVKKIKNIGE